LGFPNSAFANVAEFTVPHTYMASRDYTFNDARAAAMQEAQAALLQQLGVLVEARQNLVRREVDGISQEDFMEEAKTYTLGRVQTSILPNTENFAVNSDGAMVFSATFRMAVDTADLFFHLNSILAQRKQARADSIAQIERARADSISRAQRISQLEQSVRTTRRLLEQEQERERPLRMERDRKEREVREAAEQRNSAQIAFDNARNAGDAHTSLGMRRVENERVILQEATEYQNRKQAEFAIADENWRAASQRVAVAQNNLQIAENNLSQEIGASPRPVSNLAQDTRPAPTTATPTPAPTAPPAAQRQEQRVFENLNQRRTQGEFDTRTELSDFAAAQRATRPQTAEQRERGGAFVFSIRPEFVAGSEAMAAGIALELGTIANSGFYFSGELNGGAVYFGAMFNLGAMLNKDAPVKNVLGASAGYRIQYYSSISPKTA